MGAATTSTGRGGGRRRGGIISAINVTPMVDIVLVLLIILMVSSTYIVSQTLKVELPRARTTDGTSNSPTTLTLLKDGTLRINQQPLDEAAVDARLAQEVQKTPDLSLIISADREVPHGRVVHYIDLARVHGIRRFAINVEHSN